MNIQIRKIAETCSKWDSKIPESWLLTLRPYVESFLDRDWLNAQLKYYENWALVNSDPVLQSNLLHRPSGFNMLAASIWAARYWEREREELSTIRLSSGAKSLINIACNLAVLELYANDFLNPGAYKYLRQRLQSMQQVRGVLHELRTYTYFIKHGAEVIPHFLQRANRQEIMVRWKGINIPVQCKSKEPGAGRVISQDIFTELAGCIARDARAARKKLIVSIGSTGTIQDVDLELLRRQASQSNPANTGPILVRSGKRVFSIQSEILSDQVTVNMIRDYISNFHFHLAMTVFEPTTGGDIYDTVSVVGIKANLQEKPWNSLQSSIKRGAKQLINGPPGILAIHYTDPVTDFEALGPSRKPLIAAISELLKPFTQIGAVILSSEPNLQLPESNVIVKPVIFYRKPWSFPADFLVSSDS
jgi:hypothetical protein